MCTFVGHTAGSSIRCIDLVAEFSMIVSGDSIGCVCVWNYRTKRLVRMLCQHSGPLLSLSINSLGGHICTLTSQHLRLFTINGDLLSEERMHYSSDEDSIGRSRGSISSIHRSRRIEELHGCTVNLTGANCSETDGTGCDSITGSISPVANPSVVLSPPAMDWQDGVVAITGHKSGLVHLWKLRHLTPTDVAFAQTQKVTSEGGRSLGPQQERRRRPLRKLYIAHSLPQTHRAEITALKLCSSAISKTTKDFVPKAFDDSRSLDLLIGDSAGYASRWATVKLDQLPHAVLQAVTAMQAEESR
jgi:hypothetical protein